MITDQQLPFLILFAAYILTVIAQLAILAVLTHLYRHLLDFRDPINPEGDALPPLEPITPTDN